MNRDPLLNEPWRLLHLDTYTPFERRLIGDHMAAQAVGREVDTKPLILVDPGTVIPIRPPTPPDLVA